MAITLNGTTGITTPDVNTDDLSVDTDTLFVDATNNRVGIGTSSPQTNLEIRSLSTATLRLSTSASSNAGDPAYDFGAVEFFTPDLSGIGPRVVSKVASEADTASSAPGGELVFHTAAINNTIAERMRIDSSGNVGIGTTVAVPNSGLFLQNNGRINFGGAAGSNTFAGFYANAVGVGSITTNGTATSYNTSSDYRLKEDVQPMVGASDRVLSLNPVNFAWKADGSRVDGFLAHEAQEIVPEAVIGTKDAVDKDGNPVYQGIDQSKLVPLLTAALQEALTKISQLETRIAALEGGA